MPSIGNSLIVILGATAVGKTVLGIELAQAIGGEIIGADSRQVYRYMDIGTAKPTPKEQEQAPHHLIDIINPDTPFTLAEYQALAYQHIDEIHSRNQIPILVGGTGQYITAVIEGWSIPRVPPNWDIRKRLEDVVTTEGHLVLYKALERIDPTTAKQIHPNNTRRVIRAMEVYEVTGTPISQLQQKHPPPYQILVHGLTLPREQLFARADQRVDAMIANGFVEEVASLLDRGYDRSLPSMSGLGYKELTEHILDGVSLPEAIQKTKSNTHRFIRRQTTWFQNHNHDNIWHNRDTIDTQQFIIDCRVWLGR